MTEPAQKRAPLLPRVAKREDYNTPERVLEPVRRIFGGSIDFDPCGNPGSIVGAKKQVWLPRWCYSTLNVEFPIGVALEPGHVQYVTNPPVVVAEVPSSVVCGDGLAVPWEGNTFINPPFRAEALTAFMEKAAFHAELREADSILLTQVKSDLVGWHQQAIMAPAICFIRGRLQFGGAPDPVTYPCALLLFTKSRELVHRFALELDGKLGDVMFH